MDRYRTERQVRDRLTLPLTMVGILLVLVLASSCGKDNQFGGPYGIREDKVKEQKIADFTVYELQGLSVSEAAILNTDLFERSIRWYRNNTDPVFPYGDKYQRYNYVVTTDKVIFVAVWKAERLDLSHLDKGKDDPECTEVAHALNSRPDLTEPIMINFYPEEPGPVHKRDKPFSPCWVGFPTGGRAGLLDALNKHFMLAQGDDPADDLKEWTKTKVAYAGEIIVDVEQCLYTITNGSGTYLRGQRGDLKDKTDHLRKVAKHFSDKDSLPPPAFVETIDKDGEAGLAVYTADSTIVETLPSTWCN